MIPAVTMPVSTAETPTWWWLLGRTRGAGLAARLSIVVAAVATVGAIRIASTDAAVALDVAVLALSLVAAAVPDSHVGLALVAMIGVDWWVQVDDVASPWSIAVASSVAVLHASLAA